MKIKSYMHQDFLNTLCGIILACLCSGIYFYTLNNTFVHTDANLLMRAADRAESRNPYSNTGAAAGPQKGWDAANPLVPMAALSRQKQVWGNRPFGYHLLQICIHLCCGLALFAVSLNILKRPLPDGGAMPRPELYTLPAAALFLCHPVSAANVSWISAQKELLVALFLLAATAFFMYDSRRTKQSVSLFYALSVLFYALAVFSGPASALWVLVLCVQARFAVPDTVNRVERLGRAVKLIPFAALSIISWFIIIRDNSVVARPDAGAFHAASSLSAAADYLHGALLPFGLSPVLHHPASHGNFSTAAAIGAGILICALFSLLFSLVFRRFYVLGLIAAISLSTLIPNTLVSHDYMTDARPYQISLLIPLIFLSVSSLARISSRTRISALSFAVVLISVYSISSIKMCRVYQNDVTFWTGIVKAYPDEGQSWYMLGMRLTMSRDYHHAERALQNSISIEPDNPRFHYGLGRYYLHTGLLEKAEQKFTDSYNVASEGDDIRNNLWYWFYEVGYQLLKLKKYEDAKRNFNVTIQLNPWYPDAHAGLAYVFTEQGDYYNAYREMAITSELEPDNDVIRKNRDLVLKKARKRGYKFEIKGITKPFFDNLRKKKAASGLTY